MKSRTLLKWCLFLLIFGCFFSIQNVNAANTCTTQEKNKLIQQAYNIKFDYEFVNYKDEYDASRFYKITASNITPEIYIQYNSINYYYDTNKQTAGVITFQNVFSPNASYDFKIYASTKSSCNGTQITYRSITTPVYNVYSEMKECEEYKDFKLCNKNYAGQVNDELFKKELEKYKNTSKTTQKVQEKDKKDESFLQKIISLYLGNLIIAIPCTVIFVGVVILIVLKIYKKKNQTRLKL